MPNFSNAIALALWQYSWLIPCNRPSHGVDSVQGDTGRGRRFHGSRESSFGARQPGSRVYVEATSSSLPGVL